MYTLQKDTNIRKYQKNRRMNLHSGFGCKSGRYRDIVKREKKKIKIISSVQSKIE